MYPVFVTYQVCFFRSLCPKHPNTELRRCLNPQTKYLKHLLKRYFGSLGMVLWKLLSFKCWWHQMLSVNFHGVNLSTILHVSHWCEDEPPEPLPEDGKWRWFQPPVDRGGKVIGQMIDRYLWRLFPENVILSNHYCMSMDCDGLMSMDLPSSCPQGEIDVLCRLLRSDGELVGS